MKCVSYKKNGELLNSFFELIARLYYNNGQYVKYRQAAVRRYLETSSNFLKSTKYHNIICLEGGEAMAHLSLIRDERLPRRGLFGFFECREDTDVFKVVWREFIRQAKKEGVEIISGPVDFSVWHNFRLACSSANKPFLSEPFNCGYYRNFFLSAGLSVSKKNITSLVALTDCPYAGYQEFFDYFRKAGIEFERLTDNNFLTISREIYQLAKNSFRDFYLSTPVDYEEFCFLTNVRSIIKDQKNYFIFLIRVKATIVAYLYCYLDRLVSEEKRLVVKNLVISPDWRGKGLGKAIMYFIQQLAKREGWKSLIFSTMDRDNSAILKLTKTTDENIYREYELYNMQL